MSTRSEIPSYNPLNDPALASYFQRKFQWGSTREPPARSQRTRTKSAKIGASSSRKKKTSSGEKTIRLRVHTSKSSSPASKSDKLVTIVGTKGKTEKLLLAAPGVHFKAGTVDKFDIAVPTLGAIRKVRLVAAGLANQRIIMLTR